MKQKGTVTIIYFCLVALAGMLLVACAPPPANMTPTVTLFVPPTLPSPTVALDAPILGSISTPTSGPVTPTFPPATATHGSVATIITGTVEPTSSATLFSTQAPTATRECVLETSFLEDVTIPDDTIIKPGAAFTKTWRVENTGNCDWTDDVVLVFLWGTQMAKEEEIPVPRAKAGSKVDISVDMIAPTELGVHVAMWQLQTADGRQAGVQLYLRVVVQED